MAGHAVSPDTVGRLLKEDGYSLQGNAKTVEGKQHPDRDGLFRLINELVREFQAAAVEGRICRLAEESGLEVSVSHFPPGTSKWNRIEYRLFAQISMNWRRRPLTSHEVIVETIAATTTTTGLTVQATLDTGTYEKGIKISD